MKNRNPSSWARRLFLRWAAGGPEYSHCNSTQDINAPQPGPLAVHHGQSFPVCAPAALKSVCTYGELRSPKCQLLAHYLLPLHVDTITLGGMQPREGYVGLWDEKTKEWQ